MLTSVDISVTQNRNVSDRTSTLLFLHHVHDICSVFQCLVIVNLLFFCYFIYIYIFLILLFCLLYIFQKVSPPTNFEQQKPFIYETVLLCKDIKVMTVGISICFWKYSAKLPPSSLWGIIQLSYCFSIRSATETIHRLKC